MSDMSTRRTWPGAFGWMLIMFGRDGVILEVEEEEEEGDDSGCLVVSEVEYGGEVRVM